MAETSNPEDVFDGPDTPQGQPKSVLALGALGLMFGLTELFAMWWAIFPFWGEGNLPQDFTRRNAVHIWVALTGAVGLALSTMLMIAGIGCLRLRNWGRVLMLVYGVATLIVNIVGIGFYYRWFDPPIRQQIVGVRGVGPLAGVAQWVIGTGMAVTALVYLTRPRIKAAFGRASELPEDVG